MNRGNSAGGAFSTNNRGVWTAAPWEGNSAHGPDARGGGLARGGAVTVTNSTLSGNFTAGAMGGGAIATGGALTLTNDTIVQNYAPSGKGGGIAEINYQTAVTVSNSILAQNTDGGTAPDLYVAS